jgi:hypothetical protein
VCNDADPCDYDVIQDATHFIDQVLQGGQEMADRILRAVTDFHVRVRAFLIEMEYLTPNMDLASRSFERWVQLGTRRIRYILTVFGLVNGCVRALLPARPAPEVRGGLRRRDPDAVAIVIAFDDDDNQVEMEQLPREDRVWAREQIEGMGHRPHELIIAPMLEGW